MFESILRSDPCFVHLINDLSERRQASDPTHTAAPPLPPTSSLLSSSSLRSTSMPLLPAAVLAGASTTADEGFDVVDEEDDDDASSFHSVPEDFEASGDALADDGDGGGVLGTKGEGGREGGGRGNGVMGGISSIPISSTDPDIHHLPLARWRRGRGERRRGQRLAAVMEVARKALDWSRLSRPGRKATRKRMQNGIGALAPEAARNVPEPTGLVKVVTELRLEEGRPVIGGETGETGGEEVKELGWPFVGAAKGAQALAVVDQTSEAGGMKDVSVDGESERGRRMFRNSLRKK